MKTTRYLLPLLLLLICLASWSCNQNSETPGRNFTLAFTHDAQGELAHCGCRGGAAGGLPRRVGYLAKLREELGDSLLAVEAGDFLFPIIPETEREREIEAERVKLLADAYRRAGYDALLFGRRDYALGVDVLQQAARTMQINILGANITRTDNASLPWLASIVVKRNGLRIGMLGLLTREKGINGAQLPWPAELAVEDPVAAAKRIVPDLRSRCDVLILVANLAREELKTLLGEVKKIDFVVRSRDAKLLTHHVEREAGVPVLSLYELGRYVGRLDVTVVEPRRQYTDLAERQILVRKIERYQDFVQTIQSKAGGEDKVEEIYRNDRLSLSRYRRYVESIERWTHELARIRMEGNRFNYQLVELDGHAPENTELQTLVDDFEKRHGTAAEARGRQLRELRTNGAM